MFPAASNQSVLLFSNMETIVEEKVGKASTKRSTAAVERQFRHLMTFIIFLMIIYICLALMCAPKNYYTTFSKLKEQKLQQLSELVCGNTNQSGNFCHSPCWNGPPYKEPGFLISPACDKYHNKTLIYVYSTLKNAEQRQMIRERFRREVQSAGIGVMMIFVVGEYKNSSMSHHMKNIRIESKTYDDIFQIDVEESYFHLGFKTIGFFTYIKRCGSRGPKVLVKIDDDASKIFTTINPHLRAMERQELDLHNNLICVSVVYHNDAHEPKFKTHWQSSPQQYFGSSFPGYCQGNMGTFLAPATAVSLLEAAKGQRVFHLNDVFVGGLLRQRACINLIDRGGPIMFIVNVIYKFLSLTESLQIRNMLDLSIYDRVS